MQVLCRRFSSENRRFFINICLTIKYICDNILEDREKRYVYELSIKPSNRRTANKWLDYFSYCGCLAGAYRHLACSEISANCRLVKKDI